MKLPTKYSEARRALAAAVKIDEVKNIRDQSLAMEVYAYQAKDCELVGFATEMRKRAERRIGELMGDLREAGKLKQGGPKVRSGPLLADLGIDKHLADRARKAAAMTAKQFERWVLRAVNMALAAVQGKTDVIRAARAEAMEEKLERRASRHASIRTAANRTELSGRRFPLLYADAPWHFLTRSEMGTDRAAENHYPTLSHTDIMNYRVDGRPIADLAYADAALFFWCTSSNLDIGLAVLEAWGFTFKSSAVWVKDKTGTGYIFRNRHELLLYGSRGNMPAPLYVPDSVFMAPRQEHSRKPGTVREALEMMYPQFGANERLELFARGPVPGWTVYGLEARTEAA